MGPLYRLLGTRAPDAGTDPADPADLRRRLLALDGPDRPWRLHDGATENVDLLAEWATDVGGGHERFQTLIRLDAARHVAWTLDRSWTTAPGDAEYGQGGVVRRSADRTLDRDEHGRRRPVRSGGMDTRLLEDPLRDTVTAAGWTWRGCLRGP